MNSLTEKVKAQLNQLNGSITQAAKAGRGLVVVMTEEGKKQLSDLIKAGEAQENQGIKFLDQVKKSLPENLDVKSSAQTLGFAALGLFNKAKTESARFFNELVALGATEVEAPKNAARKTAPRKTA